MKEMIEIRTTIENLQKKKPKSSFASSVTKSPKEVVLQEIEKQLAETKDGKIIFSILKLRFG